MKRYLLNLLIGLDQFANCWLDGDPDETISSRVGKAAFQNKRWALVAELFINWLFDNPRDEGRPGHCRGCIEWDEV